MMQGYINWEKKQIQWWKKKLGLSEHGLAWISFIKGILVGSLVYDFYGVEKKFEIEIIDGIDFKVKKYFDIPINNWKLESLAPSITRATKHCLDINQTKS